MKDVQNTGFKTGQTDQPPAERRLGGGTGAWETWWHENAPYLFYSELAGYLWYVDPLAKKRGVPSKDFRGPQRADK